MSNFLSRLALTLGMTVLSILPTQAADEPAPRVIKNIDKPYPSFGKIERKDPRFDKLIAPDAKLEKLAEGFAWSEGPVWIKNGGYVLFSDIPNNAIRKWKEGEGLSLHLQPAGYTGEKKRGGEPGTNGLTTDSEGRLVMCEHGDRRITRQEKDGKKTILADKFEGKRFNSPNDLCYKSNGDLYFTDPPYGLEKNWDDPTREQDYCGVYRLSKDGTVTLLTKDVSRPNGLAFSPDEKTLYVAVSDPAKAQYLSFPVQADGTLGASKLFFDAGPWAKEKRPGLPDGMKVDKDGNLWATGPGGVHLFTPDGTHLGTINTGERTANCNWGEDGSVLYITADMYLARIKTGTKGNGW